MATIRNVRAGDYVVHPTILATTGVASCVAVVIELENGVFIDHATPLDFSAGSACNATNTRDFLETVFQRLILLDNKVIMKQVYLIGGWANEGYEQLRDQIDVLRKHTQLTFKENVNQPSAPKTAQGQDKNDNDSDHEDDYLFDSTIIYEHSPVVSTLIILQYGGREDIMGSDRLNSSLFAVYQVDTTTHKVQASICPAAVHSPHYGAFANQVLFNVKEPSFIHETSIDQSLQKILDNFLPRIEAASLFDSD